MADKFAYQPLRDDEFMGKFSNGETTSGWQEQVKHISRRYAPSLCVLLALFSILLYWRLAVSATVENIMASAEYQEKVRQCRELEAKCSELQQKCSALEDSVLSQAQLQYKVRTLEARLKEMSAKVIAVERTGNTGDNKQPLATAVGPHEISLYVPYIEANGVSGVLYLYAPERVPALVIGFCIKRQLFYLARDVDAGWHRLLFAAPDDYQGKNDIHLLYTVPDLLPPSSLPTAYRQMAQEGKTLNCRALDRDTREAVSPRVWQAYMEYLQTGK
jgi:cell division protein FtsB